MTAIVDANGDIITVVATTDSGVKIALTSKEQMDEFFLTYPNARLEFLKAREHDGRKQGSRL